MKQSYFVRSSYDKKGGEIPMKTAKRVEMVSRHKCLRGSHRLIVSDVAGTLAANLCDTICRISDSESEVLEFEVRTHEIVLTCQHGIVVVKNPNEIQVTIGQRIRHHGLRVKPYRYKNYHGIVLLPSV